MMKTVMTGTIEFNNIARTTVEGSFCIGYHASGTFKCPCCKQVFDVLLEEQKREDNPDIDLHVFARDKE
jgi:hypothetical protein